MIWLSDEAIEYAVAKCRRERGYRIAIAVPSMDRIRNIECILRSILRPTDEFRTRRKGGLTIDFNNGSRIKVLTANDNARGYRVHLLIADEDINDEIIDCVLRPCEILEYYERQQRQKAEEYWTIPIANNTAMIKKIFLGIDDDKEVTDVSEEEFMNILNVPNSQ